jgi:DNA repair exonuclease SbcCD ATPase subunit
MNRASEGGEDGGADTNSTEKGAGDTVQNRSEVQQAVRDVLAALEEGGEDDEASARPGSRSLAAQERDDAKGPKESGAESRQSWLPWGLVIGACVALWSMHEEVKKAQAQADAAHAEISDLRSKLDELSSDTDECGSKIKDLESTVDDLEAKIGNLESNADDLEARVSDLE